MKLKNNKGFTLIELMIVIAIIGILSAIAIPQYQSYVAKTEAGNALATISPLKTAVETAYAEGRVSRDGSTDLSDLDITTSSDLGTIEGTLNGTGLAYITMTLDGDVSTNTYNKEVELARDANGSWTCTTDLDAAYAPRGCSTGNESES